MEGHFDVKLFDAHGMSDADFLALQANLKPEAFLRKVNERPKVQHAFGENLVLEWVADYTFFWILTGPAIEDPPGGDASSNHQGLSFIDLSTIDTEPSYTEYNAHGWYGVDFNNVIGAAAPGTTGSKRMNDVIVTSVVFTDTDGREGIWYRSTWLWLPSQGISSNIRSLHLWSTATHDNVTNYPSKCGMTRIRLKDAGGTPVIINKTTSQVLLVEYTFKMVSV